MKHFTVSCEDDVYNWLMLHPEINKSGLFQRIAEYMMKSGRASIDQEDLGKTVSRSA